MLKILRDLTKHREADIKWLEDELKQARDIIDQVLKWMNEYKKLK